MFGFFVAAAAAAFVGWMVGSSYSSAPRHAPIAPSRSEYSSWESDRSEVRRMREELAAEREQMRQREREREQQQREWEQARKQEVEAERQRQRDEEQARRQEAEAERQRMEARRQEAEAERQRMEQTRRQEAEAERQRIEKVMEDLQRRHEEIRKREEAVEATAREHQRREEEARNYPVPSYLQASDHLGKVNIGIIGDSGVGKSSFINAVRNVTRKDATWAPVGVGETTASPQMYAFPGEPSVRLWDQPGAGTPNWPFESYIKKIGLRHFDAVLVVSSGRFTEIDMKLMEELKTHDVPTFAVRQKTMTDVKNNQIDNNVGETETLRMIADDLRRNGVDNPYLVDSRHPNTLDYEKLERDLHASFVASRKYQ